MAWFNVFKSKATRKNQTTTKARLSLETLEERALMSTNAVFPDLSFDGRQLTMSQSEDKMTIELPAVLGDQAVTYSARQAPSPAQLAYETDQRLGLYQHAGGYFTNVRGQNEKYLRGPGGWFTLMSDGKVYAWAGTMDETLTSRNLIAGFDSTFHADPSLIWNAQPPTPSMADLAAETDQRLGLYQHAGGYFTNVRGQHEKYLRGPNGWFCLMPDGKLYTWAGTMDDTLKADNLVATFDAGYHADPSPLWRAALPVVSLTHNQLTIDPSAGYLGSFRVEVTARAGSATTTGTVIVTVTNSAPVLNAIPDQTIRPDQDSVAVQLSATDVDLGAVTYGARVMPSKAALAYQLDQQLGWHNYGNYFHNQRGQNEKYVRGFSEGAHRWYFVMPTGEVYRWAGSMTESLKTDNLLGVFEASYWEDPGRLWDAGPADPIPVTVTAHGNQLTIDPAQNYAGNFEVEVTATDGATSVRRIVHVSVLRPYVYESEDEDDHDDYTAVRRWNRNTLTYGFISFTPDMFNSDIRNAVAAAFALWSHASPLTFTEVDATRSTPDLAIGFFTSAHGDGSSFDGPGGTLAHAFYPPPNGGTLAGDIHFDDSEFWGDGSGGSIDLVTVAAHEIGHALGLGHESGVRNALMYPNYSGPHRFLDADDIAGIQSLYGARQLLAGTYYFNGACQVIEDSNGRLRFVNEHGHAGEGHWLSSTRIQATGWGNLAGTVTRYGDGHRRIDWDNGTFWDTRTGFLGGTYYFNGTCRVIESSTGNLTFVNETGSTVAGRWLSANRVVATAWNNLAGTVTSYSDGQRRIDWDNGTFWDMRPGPLTGTYYFNGSCQVTESSDGRFAFVNESGELTFGRRESSNRVRATGWGNLGGTVELGNGYRRINWDNGTFWDTRTGLLAGDYQFNGRCKVTENADGRLTFINEHGHAVAGHWATTNRVVATGWGNLGGTVTWYANGKRSIAWDNGTTWSQ